MSDNLPTPGAPLDVDRFPWSYALDPREAPGWGGIIWMGTGGEIHFCIKNVTRGLPEGDHRYLVMRTSTDNGRTWGPFKTLRDKNGDDVWGEHYSIFRMNSGKLGMVYGDNKSFPNGHPGRDEGEGMMFRASDNEGETWSDPVLIKHGHALCTNGHAIVMSSGRIVAPAFRWISHDATGESEEFFSPSLSYSFVLVSDDEGETWKHSLSELIVSHYRAAYDLEEPTVLELKDGRLLMHLRSQLGRMYRSYSEDGGICWSRPEGLPIASAYTPTYFTRMPGDEILMIWNQSSVQEILTGCHRQRLSCAISRDEGETWENFKNLESLDDTTVVPPPPMDRIEVFEQWEEPGYYQPLNTKRYHRAPGVVRICYPSVVFSGEEAVVTYDYGLGTLNDEKEMDAEARAVQIEGRYGTKCRTIPIDWFTS